jgi:hypothetical protein
MSYDGYGFTGDQELIDRLNEQAFANVYQQADRILSNQDVTCEFRALGDIPACSVGAKIYFNTKSSRLLSTEEGLVSFTGLNYHELSHVMFTPPVGTWLTNEVIAAKIHDSYNILEDQRIESLMVAKYRNIASYFVATFVQYCLDDEQSVKGAYALGYGRRYLPLKLREALRKQYEKPEHLEELESLIDEYRKMAFKRDGLPAQRRAFVIVKRFDELLNELSNPPAAGNGHSDERVAQEVTITAEIGAGQAKAGAGDQVTEQNQAKAQGALTTLDAKGDPAYDKHNGEAEGEGESDSGKKPKAGEKKPTGGGAGGKGHKAHDPNNVTDIAKDIKASLGANQVMQDDVRSKARIARKAFGKTALPPKFNYGTVPVDPDYAMMSRKFAQSLQRIWIDTDPGWRRGMPDGRLNIRRAMDQQHHDPDTVFDRWVAGESDATDLEVVVLPDRSGSMDGKLGRVSQAVWAIKKAIDSIGGKTTVYAYDTKVDTVYTSVERCKPNAAKRITDGGNTDPLSAIMSAGFLFEKSEATTKILITLTDGAWRGDTTKQHELIKQMKARGVITALAFFGSAGISIDRVQAHEHASKCVITSAMDLVTLSKGIVSHAMLETAGRR